MPRVSQDEVTDEPATLPTRDASAEPSTAATLVPPEAPVEASAAVPYMARSRPCSAPDDVASASSVGEVSKTAVMSLDSTCAASTLSGGTSSSTSLLPLLKASPPTPVGRLAGRYRVRLWRPSAAQSFGISFGSTKTGKVTIVDDMPHIGLRKGDEVLSLNGQPATCVRQSGHILAGSCDLELMLYHREIPEEAFAEKLQMPLCNMFPEPRELPSSCESCFNPPEPRCRAHSFPLRDLLLTTGPVPLDACGTFTMQIVRKSRMQPFGLVIAATPLTLNERAGGAVSSTLFYSGSSSVASAGPPAAGLGMTNMFLSNSENASLVSDEAAHEREISEKAADGVDLEPVAMLIKESLPQLGLIEGDELLQINGAPATSIEACKVALRTAMTLSLDLRRPGHIGLVKRLEEPCTTSASSVKDADNRSGQNWLPGFWRRLAPNICCLGPTLGSDDHTGLDRSHDISLSTPCNGKHGLQPV